ncbi:MAG: ACT domain-containing protein [Candidatus Adiutrix intracellularis]|jgi:glycine cleavage system transcriptional repressor|nr:ACT domain-containing protein [Candidatus Adiutrix intracellularis]
MRNVLVTILGRDRPGIIHQVSRVLADFKLNVIEVSQTTLLGEFAGLFSCTLSSEINLIDLTQLLDQKLESSGLTQLVREVGAVPEDQVEVTTESYVVTVRGQGRPELIPEISGVLSSFEVNIDTLRAISLPTAPYHPGQRIVMFFELSVPRETNQAALREALKLAAKGLGMEMSLQHRNIFEAIHRL